MHAAHERVGELVKRGRAPDCLGGERAHNGQHVAHPVVELNDEQALVHPGLIDAGDIEEVIRVPSTLLSGARSGRMRMT